MGSPSHRQTPQKLPPWVSSLRGLATCCLLCFLPPAAGMPAPAMSPRLGTVVWKQIIYALVSLPSDGGEICPRTGHIRSITRPGLRWFRDGIWDSRPNGV